MSDIPGGLPGWSENVSPETFAIARLFADHVRSHSLKTSYWLRFSVAVDSTVADDYARRYGLESNPGSIQGVFIEKSQPLADLQELQLTLRYRPVGDREPVIDAPRPADRAGGRAGSQLITCIASLTSVEPGVREGVMQALSQNGVHVLGEEAVRVLDREEAGSPDFFVVVIPATPRRQVRSEWADVLQVAWAENIPIVSVVLAEATLPVVFAGWPAVYVDDPSKIAASPIWALIASNVADFAHWRSDSRAAVQYAFERRILAIRELVSAVDLASYPDWSHDG